MNSANEHIDTIAKLIKDIQHAMLTSVTADGHLHACPMGTAAFEPESRTVWFLADPTIQTLQDIQNNPQVNLSYTDGKNYLSINGTAEITDNPAKVEELWSAFHNAFFEHGKEEVRLIKVTPNGAQYWLGGNSVANMVKITAGMLTGNKIADSLGESHSVDL